jgi:hypothetical protein
MQITSMIGEAAFHAGLSVARAVSARSLWMLVIKILRLDEQAQDIISASIQEADDI